MVFTVVGIGLLIHALIPTMPLAIAFALAAIVSPTDPVALSSITARVPLPPRLRDILQGESLLNDASGLVCFRFAVAAAMTGRLSLASATGTFLWLALAGLAVGVSVTLMVTGAQRWLGRLWDEPTGAPILVSLLMPFGAYLLAERLHASGILAAVAAGITMNRVELTGRALAITRLQRAAVWDTVQFALNGVVFVLLGEQLPAILRGGMSSVAQSGHASYWWLALDALAINLGLALLRLAWVWTSLRLTLFRAHLRGKAVTSPSWRLVLATSLAGTRGAITLAGVLTLPLLMPDGSPFPARGLTIFLATAVILVSLLLASFGLPRLLKGLDLPPEAAELRGEDHARHEAARAAIVAIEAARRPAAAPPADAVVYAEAATRLLGLYERRLAPGTPGMSEDATAARARGADAIERSLRLVGLRAERDTIFGLARARGISDPVARKLVRELDLLEARYR